MWSGPPTGLHIHSGGPTVSGPVVINTGLSAANNVVVKAGADVVHRPAQVDGANAAALAALRGLFSNPQDYYVNIHTTDFRRRHHARTVAARGRHRADGRDEFGQ